MVSSRFTVDDVIYTSSQYSKSQERDKRTKHILVSTGVI